MYREINYLTECVAFIFLRGDDARAGSSYVHVRAISRGDVHALEKDVARE